MMIITGVKDGKMQDFTWENGELSGDAKEVSRIKWMDGAYEMECVYPHGGTLDLSDIDSVYYYFNYCYFDDTPQFAGDMPELPPLDAIY